MDWPQWLLVILGAEFVFFGLLDTVRQWTGRGRTYAEYISWPRWTGPLMALCGAGTMAAGLWLSSSIGIYVVTPVLFVVLFWINRMIARTVKDEDLRRASELAIKNPLRILRHPIRTAKEIVEVYRLIWRSGRRRKRFYADLRHKPQEPR